jgi:hypothetical protein
MAAMSGALYRGREVDAPSLLFVGGSETRMLFSQIGTCSCVKQRHIQICFLHATNGVVSIIRF